jgi:hypothetical protein
MEICNRFSRTPRGFVLPLSAVCLVLLCAAAWARGDHRRRHAASPKPLFAAVAVMPFTVEPEPPAGVAVSPTQPERLRIAAEQVTEHVHHWLLKKRLSGTIAGRVHRATSPADETLPFITGTVRLPVSLPTGRQERHALFARERFATAKVTMQFPDGTTLEAEAALNGKDVPLTRNYKRYLTYEKGIGWVLEKFAEKAVDRALQSLLSQLTSRSATQRKTAGNGKTP